MVTKPITRMTGMIELTERAFEQDAELAMGADPTRAIIELVTNSDDAYTRLTGKRKGQIRIEVERKRKTGPSLITVLDRAGGMTVQQMQDRLAKEGARTSGFEEIPDVRGLLGRGAKDCAAFGPILWRSATAEGVAQFDLQTNGHYTISPDIAKSPVATSEKYGTDATIAVEPRFKLKNHKNLREALTRHY